MPAMAYWPARAAWWQCVITLPAAVRKLWERVEAMGRQSLKGVEKPDVQCSARPGWSYPLARR